MSWLGVRLLESIRKGSYDSIFSAKWVPCLSGKGMGQRQSCLCVSTLGPDMHPGAPNSICLPQNCNSRVDLSLLASNAPWFGFPQTFYFPYVQINSANLMIISYQMQRLQLGMRNQEQIRHRLLSSRKETHPNNLV